ncbi:DUF4251 domain-containing protein [Mucilaginibacter antarcticus]|uniref:DUF4251 domain-containing protein n=1 Tax=Mucilaginibacter antarcticus TaxID=1855725 RepID=A0ABW5XQJ9_9SPHI
MKNLKLFCIAAISALSLNLGYAQAAKIDKKATKAAEVKRIITSNNYVFKANYAIPMSMAAGPLNSANYDVTVNNGQLEVYLPYFGRAFAAPRNLGTDGGIKLNTKDYDYTSVVNKKGGWDISIKPKRTELNTNSDVQQMKLNVGKDGYATMYITSLHRQPITFNGYVEEVKK